jgi:DNA-binding CsgD family transcriptional regulator
VPKAKKPDHVLNHGGRKRVVNGKRKKTRVAKVLGDKENMTVTRWQKVIEATANGASHREAANAAGISVMTVDAYLISNVQAAGQIRDAKMIWYRRDWPMDQLEEILAWISLGKTVKQAFDKCGIDRKRLGSLYRVLLKDKAIRSLYDEARELQAECLADDIIDISDETMNDRNEDGKIDHEVINRSRLRVDSRKWLSGKWNLKRFGDNKHVQVDGDLQVNHAAILSGGRKRLEALGEKRKKSTPAVIDNDSGRVVINE